MLETKKEKLTKILQQLMSTGDTEGCAVITRDGLLIASELRGEIDGDTLAAMTATMTGAAETAVQELNKGTPDRVIVESEKTKLIAIGAGKQAILVNVVQPKAKLGMVLMDMKKASAKVKKVLE